MKRISRIVQFACGLLVVYFAIRYEFKGMFYTLLTLFLSLCIENLLTKYRIILPDFTRMCLDIFLFCSMTLGTGFHYYSKYSWWDMFLHFFSGFMLALVGHALYKSMTKSGNILLAVLFSLFFAMTCASLWEIYEFVCDQLLHTNMQQSMVNNVIIGNAGLIDTMTDIIMGAIGSLIGVFAIYNKGE